MNISRSISLLRSLFLLFSLPALSQGVWTQRASFPAFGRNEAIAFSNGVDIFFGGGTEILGPKHNDLWKYDPSANSWTALDTIPSTRRFCAVAFEIGNSGYVGTGFGTGPLQDFWEYNTMTGVWTQKANFAGGLRYGAFAFSIGNKGYVGDGYSPSGYVNDFYEYNPVSNTWTAKANYGGGIRQQAVSFSLGGFGYVGTGTNGTCQNDFWKYDPITDSWTAIAPFPGQIRMTSAGFVIGNKAYVGTGWTPSQGACADVYAYDPALNSWTPVANFPTNREGATAVSNGSRGFLGNGNTQLGPNYQTDWWEFVPDSILAVSARPPEEFEIKIGPNPASQYIQMTSPQGIQSETTIRICDVHQRTVKYFRLTTTDQIEDISSLTSGVYFVYAQMSGKSSLITKLVVGR